MCVKQTLLFVTKQALLFVTSIIICNKSESFYIYHKIFNDSRSLINYREITNIFLSKKNNYDRFTLLKY